MAPHDTVPLSAVREWWSMRWLNGNTARVDGMRGDRLQPCWRDTGTGAYGCSRKHPARSSLELAVLAQICSITRNNASSAERDWWSCVDWLVACNDRFSFIKISVSVVRIAVSALVVVRFQTR